MRGGWGGGSRVKAVNRGVLYLLLVFVVSVFFCLLGFFFFLFFGLRRS